VGRRGSRLQRNEEVKEAFAPVLGEGVVILSEWGGGEDGQRRPSAGWLGRLYWKREELYQISQSRLHAVSSAPAMVEANAPSFREYVGDVCSLEGLPVASPGLYSPSM
jgi:hypothetical protein